MILCVIEISWDGMMLKDNYKTQEYAIYGSNFLVKSCKMHKMAVVKYQIRPWTKI